MKLTPKLSTDMTSPSRKLLSEAYSHNLSLKNSKEWFWQLGGTPGKVNGRGGMKVERPFIGKACHQLPDKGANVR